MKEREEVENERNERTGLTPQALQARVFYLTARPSTGSRVKVHSAYTITCRKKNPTVQQANGEYTNGRNYGIAEWRVKSLVFLRSHLFSLSVLRSANGDQEARRPRLYSPPTTSNSS